jgi:hypothetical protein
MYSSTILADVEINPWHINEFNKNLAAYHIGLQKDMKELLKQKALLVAQAWQKETPPWVGRNHASDSQEAKKSAENRIKRDLINSVTPGSLIFDKEFENKTLKKYVKRKDYTKLNAAMDHMPKMESWVAKPFTESLHESQQKRGSVYRNKTRKNVLTLDESKWKRYLKVLQARVGWIKAGWGVSVQALGGKVTGWVARHIANCQGAIEIVMDSDKPYIIMWNGSPTVTRYTSRYNYALWQINEKMMKDLQIQLDYRAKNWKTMTSKD